MEDESKPEQTPRLLAGLLSESNGRTFALTFLALLTPIVMPFERIANVGAAFFALGSAFPAIRASAARPVVRKVALVVSPVLIATIVVLEIVEKRQAVGWVLIIIGVLYFAVPVMVLRNIIRAESVTGQAVFGAIAMYLQIGIAFAFIYSGIERALPGSFDLAGASGFSWPTYFSFVTLTTLGYGDITPATETTDSLSILEALLGQILLVTVVARLVTLLGFRRPSSDQAQ